MDIHDRYGLTRVINAAGSFTPLGVSRSSPVVAGAAAEALQAYFVMDELQDAASRAIVRVTGAEAGAVVHCAAAGITLAIAAAMAGGSVHAVATLPDATGMANRVVLPAGHAVNYGHPIVQDIRLAGAVPVLAGIDAGCAIAEIEAGLADEATACLLLVASRLVRGAPIDLTEAVAAAHRRGVPAIIDGAAQDMRIGALLATGADLVVISAQKYLASPTAGLVIGKADLVRAVRAHEKGIGRAMKASKEAICGVLAAIGERETLDMAEWRWVQDAKVAGFVERASGFAWVDARAVPDPAGMPFARAHLRIDPAAAGRDARALADALKTGSPSIRVMEHGLDAGEIVLELVGLREDEVAAILARLEGLAG
jgi:L-seryl-tRNA(Ser) seleniumtransferase